ncbi:MAG: NAD(+) diphosphatase, partial [Pseudomonadota bacterium]
MPGLDDHAFRWASLDRAANLRSKSADLSRSENARCLPIWQGKPLIREAESARHLVWTSPHHPVLDDIAGTPMFLGLSDGVPWFTRDMSVWEPLGQDAASVDTFADPTRQSHPDLPSDSFFGELRGVMTRLTPAEAELAATARALTQWHQRHKFCANCGHPSDQAMGGWQRDCPSCGASHYPRTDPVVIMLITHGNSVLMGRSPGWPDGMYSLLAGFVEPGESPEAAVRRETFEEAGIRVGGFRYLSSQPWPFPASLMTAWAGEALNTKIT